MKIPPYIKLNSTLFAVSCLLLCPVASQTLNDQSKVLLEIEKAGDLKFAEAGRGAVVQVAQGAKGTVLRLTTSQAVNDPQLILKAPSGSWDLSSFLAVAVDVRNAGPVGILVSCRLNNSKWVDGAAAIPAAGTRTVYVLLKRKSPPDDLQKYFFGMNGLPGGYVGMWDVADPAAIATIQLFVHEPDGKKVVEASNVRALGSFDPPAESVLQSSYFPMVDAYGQYRHSDWPGKVHSREDLAERRKAEESDLSQNRGPGNWDTYGGWAGGPQLKASGRFRVEKYKGKWWLVDPEGRLFWSHGIDCVRMSNATPISSRERYFAELPEQPAALLRFYGMGRAAAHGYYHDHAPFRTYDFSLANLVRKYGEQYKQEAAAIAHRRLRSWGMNTIANWSDEQIYLQKKTPYVGTIGTGGPAIQGSQGYWQKFPDPFDPGFLEALRQRLAGERGKSIDDPWCIGYFIDNELSWGDETALALAVFTSPPTQPAKRAFVEHLKATYGRVENLNRAWSSKYPSWEAMLGNRQEPDKSKARADLIRFNEKISEEYFRLCRMAVKEASPEALYLGCRFDFHFYPEDKGEDWLIKIAAEYCDVVSFNRYRFSTRDLIPPQGVDKPLIIGEYHFGALDRGMLHTGLRSVMNQQQRAEMYKSYVRGALENPFMIGTHWFQYADQPVTGRGDGENYQIGFVDIADTPYAETIQACREMGYRLYEIRFGPRPADASTMEGKKIVPPGTPKGKP